jgi:hypothetical protein
VSLFSRSKIPFACDSHPTHSLLENAFIIGQYSFQPKVSHCAQYLYLKPCLGKLIRISTAETSVVTIPYPQTGAVYTCDFVNDVAYDSVYDLLHKVVCYLIVDQCLLKCVYESDCNWCRMENLKPYTRYT